MAKYGLFNQHVRVVNETNTLNPFYTLCNLDSEKNIQLDPHAATCMKLLKQTEDEWWEQL